MTEHATYNTISPEPTIFELQNEINALKEQLAAKATWSSPETVANRIAAVRQDTFAKEDLATAVMEYDEGCEDGKHRFLEHLGLEDYLPCAEATVTFTVSLPYMTDDMWYSFENDVNYELNRINLNRGEVDEFSIDVSRY